MHFDVRGHAFERSVASIEQAYQATINALARQIKDARIQAANEPYVGEDIGRAAYVMDREAEHPAFGWAAMWGLVEEHAWSSLAVAREAYVVILHHSWEKHCAEWMDRGYFERDAFIWLDQNSFPVDKDGITRLRMIANFLKHRNPKVRKEFPHLFDNKGYLMLDDDTVKTLFSVVKGSGIPAMTNNS